METSDAGRKNANELDSVASDSAQPWAGIGRDHVKIMVGNVAIAKVYFSVSNSILHLHGATSEELTS